MADGQRPDERWAPASLAVQIVLYDNDPAATVRLAAGLAASLAVVRPVHRLDRVVVRFGDCSRWPCLDDADQRRIRDELMGVADDVSFTFFDANLGSAGGSNALAALGDDDVLWILNPDTHPAPTAARELLDVLVVDGVGIAEARQLPVEHQKTYDRSTGETGWACGFGLMVRREAFDRVGGFDPHFFPLYCDDVDLSWRLRLDGWSIRHVPRAVIIHDKPITSDGAVRWTEAAARSSHLARLWLCRRYGRADLEASFVASIDPVTDPAGAAALAEFDARVAAGDVPSVVPGAERVAQFVDGQYAPVRFSYGR